MDNLEKAVQAVKEQFPGMSLKENEPMKAHSSFRIGGPVRALAAPSDVTGLTKLCDLLKQHHIAPFILGNGTNILFPDEGLNDLFIISTEKLQKLFLLPDGAIYAEAGVSLARLSAFAQENGLKGLECYHPDQNQQQSGAIPPCCCSFHICDSLSLHLIQLIISSRKSMISQFLALKA